MPPTDLEPVSGLSTPDPVLSSESLVAIVGMLIANAVVLFKLNLTDAQQAAIGGAITGLWLLGTFVHAAYVRGKRATGGALAPTVVVEAPVAGSDVGDR